MFSDKYSLTIQEDELCQTKCFAFNVNRVPDVLAAQALPEYVGKSAAAANLQDELTGSLIGLALAAEHAEPSSRTHRIMTEGLFTTITNVNFNEETLRKQVETVRREKELLLAQKETNFIENATTCHTPSNPDVNIEDYDMKNLWNADEDIRSLKISHPVRAARHGGIRLPCHGSRIHRRRRQRIFSTKDCGL